MLDHIEINVSNLDASRQFWRWLLCVLGYEDYQDWPSGFSMRHGDIYLVFVQASQDFLDAGFHRRRVGLNHLAFRASPSAFEQIAKELRERGISVLYPERNPYAGGAKHKAVFFEDPDRIKVEVVYSQPLET